MISVAEGWIIIDIGIPEKVLELIAKTKRLYFNENRNKYLNIYKGKK
jgi:hypothetical protein